MLLALTNQWFGGKSMAVSITRRTFLLAGTIGGFTLGATRVRAFDYSYTRSGFIDADLALLSKAMGYARWLTHPNIQRNYVNLHDGGWNFGKSGAWAKSNNDENPNPHWRKKGNLLEYQVVNLANWDEDIPIVIRGVNAEDEQWWGRANLATIAVVSDGAGKFSVEGKFELEINTWKFNAPGSMNAQNPVTWGAVIDHEMLHNLGHHHDPDEYGNDYPINLYENCVGYGGKYKRSIPRHFAMVCGGRIP
jgi:hypothetical protein